MGGSFMAKLILLQRLNRSSMSRKQRYRYTWSSSQFEIQLTLRFFDRIALLQTRYLAAQRAVVLGEAVEDSVGDEI